MTRYDSKGKKITICLSTLVQKLRAKVFTSFPQYLCQAIVRIFLVRQSFKQNLLQWFDRNIVEKLLCFFMVFFLFSETIVNITGKLFIAFVCYIF